MKIHAGIVALLIALLFQTASSRTILRGHSEEQVSDGEAKGEDGPDAAAAYSAPSSNVYGNWATPLAGNGPAPYWGYPYSYWGGGNGHNLPYMGSFPHAMHTSSHGHSTVAVTTTTTNGGSSLPWMPNFAVPRAGFGGFGGDMTVAADGLSIATGGILDSRVAAGGVKSFNPYDVSSYSGVQDVGITDFGVAPVIASANIHVAPAVKVDTEHTFGWKKISPVMLENEDSDEQDEQDEQDEDNEERR